LRILHHVLTQAGHELVLRQPAGGHVLPQYGHCPLHLGKPVCCPGLGDPGCGVLLFCPLLRLPGTHLLAPHLLLLAPLLLLLPFPLLLLLAPHLLLLAPLLLLLPFPLLLLLALHLLLMPIGSHSPPPGTSRA
jgi:hypothetical protein